jgi:hypothetical protein
MDTYPLVKGYPKGPVKEEEKRATFSLTVDHLLI